MGTLRMVTLYQHGPEVCPGCGLGTTWTNYVAWREAATSFEAMEAYATREWVLGGRAGAVRVRGAVVTAGLWTAFTRLAGAASGGGRPARRPACRLTPLRSDQHRLHRTGLETVFS